MELVQSKVTQFINFYNWAFTVADERVADWFLMSAYAPTLAITATYLLAVYIGPKLMEKREAFDLRPAIIVYNFLCVIMNFHICSELLYCSTVLGYSYSCQPVNYSYDHYELRIAKALWWFYFSKCVEMFDTIFFILRKKNNQVSFLHVYHHASMFPIWFIGVKWVAGGQSFFGAMINSFIHVIMYTYYGLAAMGPKVQKYLWWKRYLTRLQLLQFFVGVVYGVQHIVIECAYPQWMAWVGLCYGFTIIALFINFYVQAYIKPKSPPASKGSKAVQIQFVTGIVHACQSSFIQSCDFPKWMHWALIIYAFTILLFFINFYFHAYVKSQKVKNEKSQTNGKTANGHVQNGKVANGTTEKKKDK